MIKDITISKTVTTDTTQILYSYLFPSKSKGYLINFANYLSDNSAWGSIIWRIKKNGSPLYPYENVKDLIGLGYSPYAVEKILFQGGDILEIEAYNGYTSDVDIGCRIVFEESGEI